MSLTNRCHWHESLPIRMRRAARLAKNIRSSARHLCGCATGESQQQNALGIRTVQDEVCDSVGKCFRFSRPGSRDDKKRRGRSAILETVFNRCPLAFVQLHNMTALRSTAQGEKRQEDSLFNFPDDTDRAFAAVSPCSHSGQAESPGQDSPCQIGTNPHSSGRGVSSLKSGQGVHRRPHK